MNSFNYRPVTSQPLIPGEYKKPRKISQGKPADFAAALQTELQKTEGLTISKHAKERLEQRGISINANRWEQISEKVREAKKMGVKDSLSLIRKCGINCQC